jgi:hypothetical protein
MTAPSDAFETALVLASAFEKNEGGPVTGTAFACGRI